jgi:regulatory protein
MAARRVSGAAPAAREREAPREVTAAEAVNDEYRAALDVAVRFLGQRPRSEHEVRRRLARDGTPDAIVDEVLAQLRRWQLVDDAAFASYWLEQRRTFRPRGPRLLQAELRQRGVSAQLAAQAAAEAAATADQDAARVAEKRARQLARQPIDERTFCARLAQHLARRGFDWDTITPLVERLWHATRPAAWKADSGSEPAASARGSPRQGLARVRCERLGRRVLPDGC